MDDSLPARLTVSRRSPGDIGDRQVYVSVDGERMAVLLYGETATRELAPGPHWIRVHNTLVWKTRDVELAPGEHARFRVINRAGPGTYPLTALFGTGPLYLTLERIDPSES